MAGYCHLCGNYDSGWLNDGVCHECIKRQLESDRINTQSHLSALAIIVACIVWYFWGWIVALIVAIALYLLLRNNC